MTGPLLLRWVVSSAELVERSVGVAGGVRPGFDGARADGLADGEPVVPEVDLEAGVAMGLERRSGPGSESRAGGAAAATDRVAEVVGEHAGGVPLRALDGLGPLFGDHAGGGCERGAFLVVVGPEVEDVADEHLVDAFELGVQDLVSGEDLSSWPLTVATASP